MTAKEKARAYHLKRKYGLSLKDYEKMLSGQRGRCAVCRKPPAKRSMHVDHDHSTHLIRGLLCWGCNSLIPARRDLVHLFTSLAAYIADPPALKALGTRYAGKPRKPKP